MVRKSRLIELFVTGSTTRTAAHLVNVNKNTASYYFLRLREIIYTHCEALEMFDGEVDESYFAAEEKVSVVEVH
jgi:transposase